MHGIGYTKNQRVEDRVITTLSKLYILNMKYCKSSRANARAIQLVVIWLETENDTCSNSKMSWIM
jgi:hypothetical protein